MRAENTRGARSFASSLTGSAQTEAHASRLEPIPAKKMGATINTRSHFEIKRLRRVKSARGKGGYVNRPQKRKAIARQRPCKNEDAIAAPNWTAGLWDHYLSLMVARTIQSKEPATFLRTCS